MKNLFALDIGPSITSERFRVETDASLEDIREALFACREKTGIDVFSICRNNEIIHGTILSKLKELGYVFPIELFQDSAGTHLLDAKTMDDVPEVLFDIVLFLLHRTNPELHLVGTSEDIPNILWDGPDKNGHFCPRIGNGLTLL